MSSENVKKDVGKDMTGVKAAPNNAVTPPAQPAQSAPEGVNAGTPNNAVAKTAETTAVAPVNNYVPGGLSRDVVNPVVNPAQSDNNFPFATGHKMHEVAQYQNFFTFPVDTYYGVFDAIHYFSD